MTRFVKTRYKTLEELKKEYGDKLDEVLYNEYKYLNEILDQAVYYLEDKTITYSTTKEWRRHLINILNGDEEINGNDE